MCPANYVTRPAIFNTCPVHPPDGTTPKIVHALSRGKQSLRFYPGSPKASTFVLCFGTGAYSTGSQWPIFHAHSGSCFHPRKAWTPFRDNVGALRATRADFFTNPQTCIPNLRRNDYRPPRATVGPFTSLSRPAFPILIEHVLFFPCLSRLHTPFSRSLRPTVLAERTPRRVRNRYPSPTGP